MQEEKVVLIVVVD